MIHDRGPRAVRSAALEKLAALSTQKPAEHNDYADLSRLQALYPTQSQLTNGHGGNHVSTRPIGLRELDVLVALCRAAPSLQDVLHAERLLRQISPYLLECHDQSFADPLAQKALQPSPWHVIAYDVTSAILAIGANHPSLYNLALSQLNHAVDLYASIGRSISSSQTSSPLDGTHTEVDKSGIAVRYVITLYGFVSALSDRAAALRLVDAASLGETLFEILAIENISGIDAALSLLHSPSHHQTRASRPWRHLMRSYASTGNALDVMLLERVLMDFVANSAATSVSQHSAHFKSPQPLKVLDDLAGQSKASIASSLANPKALESFAKIIVESLSRPEPSDESNPDHILASSTSRIAIKAAGLYGYLCCSLVDHTIADPQLLMAWLEATIFDPLQFADDNLAKICLKCMTILAQRTPKHASVATRCLPKLIVQSRMGVDTAAVAAESLAKALLQLPIDMRISTLYSLGNVLSVGGDSMLTNGGTHMVLDVVGSSKESLHSHVEQIQHSSIPLNTTDAEEIAIIHSAVVQAVVTIAASCNDEKMTALAMSMLLQKLGKSTTIVDLKILESTSELGRSSSPNDLKSLLKTYSRLSAVAMSSGQSDLLQTITNARIELATDINKDSPLFTVYLVHLLDAIVSITGTIQSETRSVTNGLLGSDEIGQYLRPLAVLLARNFKTHASYPHEKMLLDLGRDAWFNLVTHDCLLATPMARLYASELETLAMVSPLLIDSNRVSGRESGIDLNTVLHRNDNPAHAAQQKVALCKAFPSLEAEIRGLDYAELTFLNATHLIAILRARQGDCTRTLSYFVDAGFRQGPVTVVLTAISMSAVDTYLDRTQVGEKRAFAAPELAVQLVRLLEGSCHRVAKVQRVSIQAIERIVERVPSALCQQSTIFAMLDLLTLMWKSCVEADTDEYSWRSAYTSSRGNVSLQLSDDFDFRRNTLAVFHRLCRALIGQALALAPLDTKGLLQTYLSEHDDEGAYGHVSLGRSFALEMGCALPSTDQKLTSIGRQANVPIDTASDFVAQLASRQGYRRHDKLACQSDRQSNVAGNQQELQTRRNVLTKLKTLHNRLRNNEYVALDDIKEPMRQAAGMLCDASSDYLAVVHLLVAIPFRMLTKDAVQFGMAIWIGLLKENARLEAMILTEITAQWEMCLRNRRGIFSADPRHYDPFFVKMEFAPSDHESLQRQQKHVHAIIAPLVCIVDFLTSHYNATRLCTSASNRIFYRFARVTLRAMPRAASHPLARELHFRIVLLCTQILLHATGLSQAAQARLKSHILSVALAWFSQPAKWSFGGNRLQIRTEVKIMSDVMRALRVGTEIGSAALSNGAVPNQATMQARQELLLTLMNHEIYRLTVWLNPTDQSKDAKSHTSVGNLHESIQHAMMSTAWVESPSLAVQLAVRFPASNMRSECRRLLLTYPEVAIHDAEGVSVILDGALAADVEPMLKYLLYWTPVNPIITATFFLPQYKSDAMVLQYAVRTLASHPVDITFFYVPQIVQTLRYDTLGYVESYIVETARFSQLFAHQIIWNMKANAYKDNDSLEPDAVKPVLDKVMESLIQSFSATDKDFYEREFAFFNEVTSISGKLKPFIKRPKPEKKLKIEEELRKIHVDVGVYLPSNPDGVVIGIDRQSGKPLQSHAKAPFMATFRIRKEIDQAMEDVDKQIDRSAEGKDPKQDATTLEVWQSAIFKVGDDCRQDLLALQMIAAFRGIFNQVGLNVYVYPYRVTATAPGCGVIDVLPNSISRDMLGREKVNGLYEYFVSKYGNEDSLRFQAARHEFVRSMAAYSVISYLLQFKDRHNGNIMVDDAGHILHIDFGFCFDIAPGGIKFERAPFKLTSEMVAVMGGSTESQTYRSFVELCIKAFLAARPYADKLSHLVTAMMPSELPCFVPDTVKHFRERFVLDKTERQAAEYMTMLIRKSAFSRSTTTYDAFQKLTNDIPFQN